MEGFALGEGLEDGEPVFEGPGFLGGAAAGVEDEVGGGGGGGKVWGDGEVGGGVFEEEGDFFEGAGELGGGGSLAWEDAVGALDEGFDAEAFEVAAEVAVGVEEVADDEVEGSEVVGDFLLDGGAGGEERGEVAVAEAAGVVGEAGGEGEVGDAGVTEDFEVAVGDAFSEEAYGGQGEDEVTDGAATDD